MPKFWFQDGKVVVDGTGKPIDCVDCPCSTGMSCVCTCSACPAGAPAQWTVTLTTLTNGACGDCAVLNITFTLNYVSGCLWEADPVAFCAGAPVVTFQYTGGQWVLTFPGSVLFGGATVYTLTEVPTDCVVVKTLALAPFGGFSCNGWPATIDVTPVGTGACTTVCTDCCPDGLPSTLFATFTDGATPVCACLSGLTIPIAYIGSGQWFGTAVACGHTIGVLLICNPAAGCSNFDVEVRCDGFPIYGPFGPFPVDGGCDCDPLSLVWANKTFTGACGTCTPASDFTLTILDV